MSMFRSIVTSFCRGFGCLLAALCIIEMSKIARCPQGEKWLFLKMILKMIIIERRIRIRNISTRSKKTDKTYQCIKLLSMGSCKRYVDYLIAFLNKSLTCLSGIPSSRFVWKTRGRGRRIYLLYVLSARSPEPGLLSDWSENKRSFGALNPSVKQHIWLPELLDRFCYLMVTFVSSWQKPRDDTEEKTLGSWDEDELLSAAAGKDICYFFSDAFLFPWAELLSLISDRLQLRESV